MGLAAAISGLPSNLVTAADAAFAARLSKNCSQGLGVSTKLAIRGRLEIGRAMRLVLATVTCQAARSIAPIAVIAIASLVGEGRTLAALRASGALRSLEVRTPTAFARRRIIAYARFLVPPPSLSGTYASTTPSHEEGLVLAAADGGAKGIETSS